MESVSSETGVRYVMHIGRNQPTALVGPLCDDFPHTRNISMLCLSDFWKKTIDVDVPTMEALQCC